MWACLEVWVSTTACHLKRARDSGTSEIIWNFNWFFFFFVECSEDKVRGGWVVLLSLDGVKKYSKIIKGKPTITRLWFVSLVCKYKILSPVKF